MRWGELFLLAIGLSMDAAAVSAARGLAVDVLKPLHVLKVALFFGGFQALMPLLGFELGRQFGAYLDRYGHWVAFVVLCGVGAKMLWEARGEETDSVPSNPFGMKVMWVLAVATSLDAFAAGVTLPLLHVPMLWAVSVIGATTALLSAVGIWAGRKMGDVLGGRLEMVGGLVLIGLGVKMLLQHFA